MKKILWMLSILAAALLASILLIAFVPKDVVAMAAGIISAIASLITAVFALLVYDRVRSGQKILEKRIDNIISIIDEIKKLRFFVAVHYGDGRSAWMQTSITKDFDFVEMLRRDNQYDSLMVINAPNYWTELKDLDAFRTNVWTPHEVSQALDKLQVHTIRHLDVEQLKSRFVKIGINKKEGVFIGELDNLWGSAEPNPMSVGEFFDELKAILQISEQWINTHSDHKFKLNI